MSSALHAQGMSAALWLCPLHRNISSFHPIAGANLQVRKNWQKCKHGLRTDRRQRSPTTFPGRWVKVVEHIVLFKTKAGFSEEQEKDMLDFLYTFQYHMRGIIALSLGRIINENSEGCTHALYMRFPSKEVLAQYYRNPVQSRIWNEYIIPYCHGSISVDYEAEVLDDIMPIFRRGEEFEHGVEFIVLISLHKDVPGDVIEDAFDTYANLIHDFGSTVIQHTQGTNFNRNSTGYTHGITIRFPSKEALEIFTSSSSYMNIWKHKILPIARKTLVVYFVINPVGTTIM